MQLLICVSPVTAELSTGQGQLPVTAEEERHPWNHELQSLLGAMSQNARRLGLVPRGWLLAL